MLLQTIEQIGREKNIEPEVIVAAIEEAMAVAAQKFYRTEDYLEAALNPESGELELHAVKTVGRGGGGPAVGDHRGNRSAGRDGGSADRRTDAHADADRPAGPHRGSSRKASPVPESP